MGMSREEKARRKNLRKDYLREVSDNEDRSNYTSPQNGAVEFIGENYGPVSYSRFGEAESLMGVVATRDQVFRLNANGQKYEFGNYGRPVFDISKTGITPLSDGISLSTEEKIERRRKYMEASQIGGPKIDDYSGILGEWGGNPKPEPTSKQIREIYEICSNSDIPIWFVDTLETSLSWGNSSFGISAWLRENYSDYIGVPLYRIPPVDFSKVDLSQFPLSERRIIESGVLQKATNLGEQNSYLLMEVIKLFGLDPIILDQRKLRDSGAYSRGIDSIIADKDNLQSRFGSLFRVECPSCGKYIFNVNVDQDAVKGICDGNVRGLNKGSDIPETVSRYSGCGKSLEKSIDYLYTNAIPSKLLTSIYMSNSDVGILFPDIEFPSTRVYNGIFLDQVVATGEVFRSGVPNTRSVGGLTYEKRVENIFRVLDFVPPRIIIDRLDLNLNISRDIDLNRSVVEPILIDRLKKIGSPTNSRLIADAIYSLDGMGFDFDKMGWRLKGERDYVFDLLRCLGNLRRNKIVRSKPDLSWSEDYETFMRETYVSDCEITELRVGLVSADSPVRDVIETAYIAGLVKDRLINV